jgi:hypothetical protein
MVGGGSAIISIIADYNYLNKLFFIIIININDKQLLSSITSFFDDLVRLPQTSCSLFIGGNKYNIM